MLIVAFMFMMVVCFGVLLWISSAFEFLVAIMIDMMIVMHLGYASTWYCHVLYVVVVHSSSSLFYLYDACSLLYPCS